MNVNRHFIDVQNDNKRVKVFLRPVDEIGNVKNGRMQNSCCHNTRQRAFAPCHGLYRIRSKYKVAHYGATSTVADNGLM